MLVRSCVGRTDQNGVKHWGKVFPEPAWKAFGEHVEEEYANEGRDGTFLPCLWKCLGGESLAPLLFWKQLCGRELG